MSVTSAAKRPRTRSEEVHEKVRRDILGGILQPGERLSPSALAQDYGVSLGVVREALTRLAEQGLVLSQPQLGFQVVPISREDLLDLTAVRLDIETLAVRRSVELGSVEWRSNVVAAHYVLENTPRHLDDEFGNREVNEDWMRAHAAFHDTLLIACGSKRMFEIAESLRDAADLYRRWSEPVGGDGARDIAGEHKAILEAVQAEDAHLAAERLAHHISHTTNVLLTRAT